MSARKVAVFTGTRAEYGLLHWLMRDIATSPALDLQVIAGAMHCSPEFGETWTDIVEDGFAIDARVEMLLSSNTAVGVAKSMGLGAIGFADALDRLAPDRLVVLGDRFEALAIAQAALVMRIPVVHLHGGELTAGAYDDAIRHAITKMASLHCVAAEDYRRRVIQMGEAPDTVFNVGAMGLDHLMRTPPMSAADLERSLGFAIRAPYFLVTYHPATMANENPQQSFAALADALDRLPDHQIVITYPNADNGGRDIISQIQTYAAGQQGRVFTVPSLGFVRYLTLLKDAAAVVGNSSSGIIEAPAFAVPTVNIGRRQSGRLAADSVIHCATDATSIGLAITRALSRDFREICRSAVNPYGKGDAAGRIVRLLENNEILLPKQFHDLEFRP